MAGGLILPRLCELGVPYRIATNTTTHTREELATSLQGLDLRVDPAHIHSVLEATVLYLRERDVERCYVIGEEGLLRGLRRGGIEPALEGAQAGRGDSPGSTPAASQRPWSSPAAAGPR